MLREIIIILVLISFDPFHLNVLTGFCSFCFLFFFAARVRASLMICLAGHQIGFLLGCMNTRSVGRLSIEKKRFKCGLIDTSLLVDISLLAVPQLQCHMGPYLLKLCFAKLLIIILISVFNPILFLHLKYYSGQQFLCSYFLELTKIYLGYALDNSSQW